MKKLFEKRPGDHQGYLEPLTAVSKKNNGSMKITAEASAGKGLSGNRERFLRSLGVKPDRVVAAELIHGSHIRIVGHNEAGRLIGKTDGLITDCRNLFLSITVADCLPIFFYEPDREITGLVHAGWRGLWQGIAGRAVKKINSELGGRKENIRAAIGPGIGVCHYQVKDDVVQRFRHIKGVITERDGKTFLDLKKTAEYQLLQGGLERKNIKIIPDCTYCLNDEYFSWRREKPKAIRVMMALIGVKP